MAQNEASAQRSIGDDRRQSPERPAVELRVVDRRTRPADPLQPRTHRLGRQQPGVSVYELMDLTAATDCLSCDRRVSFELPRFGEPPLRLQLEVEHEAVGRQARHVVAIEAFGATGRRLLASRVVARTPSE